MKQKRNYVEISSESEGDKISTNQQSHSEDKQGQFEEYADREGKTIHNVIIMIVLGIVLKLNFTSQQQPIWSGLISTMSNQEQISLRQSNRGSQFQIPSNLWLFDGKSQTLLNKLYYENNKYFGQQSNFKINIINQTNYINYLSPSSLAKLQNLRLLLSYKIKQDRQLYHSTHQLIYNLSLLLILLDHGGILINDYYCITSNFHWLRNIASDNRTFRGLNHGKPEIFTFYIAEQSSPSLKENIKVQYEVDKYMRIFPGFTPYFIASKKHSKFMIDLTSQIFNILSSPEIIKQDLDHYSYFGINPLDVYSNYFQIASQRTLQARQRHLDQLFKSQQYRITALSYYGIYAITDYTAARKFYAVFEDSETQFQSISKYKAEDWSELVGPFVQLTRFTPHYIMNTYLEELIQGKRDPMIEGSMLQKLLYPESNQSFIIPDPQKYFINTTNEPWHSLPKIVWVFWNNGIQNAYLNNQVCVEVMRVRAKQSGFELRILTQTNLHQYLNETYINKMKNALTNAKLRTFPQSLPDLTRLAILATHGGVYFDVSYLMVTNLDWLVNIGRYPSKFINNRYGHLPKVVMHYHPFSGGSFNWKVNVKANTKVQWQLPYQNNFIAAEKGNEFIIQWFELLLSFYQQPYSETQMYMKSFGLTNLWNSDYLMPMDTLKCVLGRRQKQISEDAASPWADASDYYKIWAINGFMGIQKYRHRTGYQSFNNPQNTFVYRYSQAYAQSFLGQTFNLIKFYGGPQNRNLSKLISEHHHNNFSMEAHPESIFMKYLMLKDINVYEQGKFVKVKH